MIPASVKMTLGNELATVLEKIFDDAPDSIVAINDTDNHNILMYNSAAARMFGYENGEAVGQPFSSILTVDNIREPELSSAPTTHIVVGKRKTGEDFPCEVKISKTKVGKHILCIATLRDISEQVERQKEHEESSHAIRAYRTQKKAELRRELKQVQQIGKFG